MPSLSKRSWTSAAPLLALSSTTTTYDYIVFNSAQNKVLQRVTARHKEALKGRSFGPCLVLRGRGFAQPQCECVLRHGYGVG